MLIHLENADQFRETIKSGTVLLDFFATWCGPCKMLTPELEKFAERHPEVTVLKIDVDEYGEIAAIFNVNAVPTLLVFKDGEQKAASAGFKPLPQLEKFVFDAQ
ncbi:MAG: thioredoxin [Bacilli bacterium]|jgi:thioredoxin 1|nr:thioredoxin [Bacilli bacterium]